MSKNLDDMSGLEIMAFIAVIVLMRGCYHVGVISEKVSPESYREVDKPEAIE